jgi:hypothetical protein
MRYCDTLDCAGITGVLRSAVSGFAEHEVRHDHMWTKQGVLGTRPAPAAAASNVKELFPDKG